MTILFFALILALTPAAPDRSTGVGLEIDPSAGETAFVGFTGPAGNVPAGEFRGRVSAYGSSIELPFAGRAERTHLRPHSVRRSSRGLGESGAAGRPRVPPAWSGR